MSGRLEIVKKIGIKSDVDDCSALLSETGTSGQPEICRMLLDAGANPNTGDDWRNPMSRLIHSRGWKLDPLFGRNNPDKILACLEMAAERRGRWRPSENEGMSSLRRDILALKRLANSGAIESETFRELMSPPNA